jgi:hypothetical protein
MRNCSRASSDVSRDVDAANSAKRARVRLTGNRRVHLRPDPFRLDARQDSPRTDGPIRRDGIVRRKRSAGGTRPHRVAGNRPDAAGATDLDALTGQLDLLVARSKYSTNSEISALNSGVTRQIAQAIEDRRVCERLFNDYPGARRFVGNCANKRRETLTRAGQPWRGATS